jgi:NADPH:quinone reductase-like Zn-dependent oxidoreductase
MRAVLHDRYGPPDVQRIADVDPPVPKAGEVLVRVHATTVNRTDCAWRQGKPFFIRFLSGLRRPKSKVLGSEFAGEIEAVGAGVSRFAVGDRVFGVRTYLRDGFGTHAELVCIREDSPLARMPAGSTIEEAAATCDGAINALTSLRRTGVGKGRRVLVYGASGSIGTAAVQLARHFEADVTAVTSTRNVEIVRSLGADVVIDYTQQDFTRNGATYDVIFDAVGKQSFWRCRGSLAPGGIYIATEGFQHAVLALTGLGIGGRRVMFPVPKYSQENVRFVADLIEAGRYRAVIDRVYPLEQVVEATRYVETAHKTGNVVLTVGQGDP